MADDARILRLAQCLSLAAKRRSAGLGKAQVASEGGACPFHYSDVVAHTLLTMDESAPSPAARKESTVGGTAVPNESDTWRAFLHFLADDKLLSELLLMDKIRVMAIHGDRVHIEIKPSVALHCPIHEHDPCVTGFTINMTSGMGCYVCTHARCISSPPHWRQLVYARPLTQ
jgi:hypothetical protein